MLIIEDNDKMYVIQPSKLKKGLPKQTLSLCPQCKKIISATIFEEDGKVIYKKTCEEHGEFKDIYYGDAEIYRKMEKWAVDGKGIDNPQKTDKDCPFGCGICDEHYSRTSLANVDLTNRCNLTCPICFANANSAGYIYEPSFDQVVDILKLLRNEKPVPTPAVQFAGGEPTIYPKFFEIIKKANELGFAQVQVATNGIKLTNPEFCQKMLDAGTHTVYLQFDGFKKETYIKARGVDLRNQKMKVIENCRNTKPIPLGIVLVPTVVRNINDDEVGKIVDFALDNLDVVRAVNFQPVSFAGRIKETERLEGRYTVADLIKDLAKQTDYIEKDDFFSIPVGALFSEMVSQIFNDPKISFTCHPHCGAATYIFKDEKTGDIIPITRFLDVDGLLEEIMTKIESEKYSSLPKALAAIGAYRLIKKYYDKKSAPTGLNLLKMLKNMFMKGDKESLGKIQWRSLMIGIMHFQDDYNYDINRVKRCVIHYATPDGRIIPFCSYNGGPTHRTEVEKKFSMTLEEYKKKTEGDKDGSQ